MNKEKLKLIVRNLELLVDSLKSEIYSDVSSYTMENKIKLTDYDEVFYDGEEDEFETIRINQKYKLTNDDDGDGL